MMFIGRINIGNDFADKFTGMLDTAVEHSDYASSMGKA